VHPVQLCVLVVYCRDGSGTIDISELAQALKDFGIFDNDAEELMKSADSNGDGQIDYQEFSFLLRSKNPGFEKSKGLKKNLSRY
jgi:Ca2+-binding EF-hand superfamily protein